MARAKQKPKAPPTWLQVGVLVDYCSVIGGPPTQLRLEVSDGPQLMSDQWVVWLKGKAGCVAVDACIPSEVVNVAADRALIEAAGEGPWALSKAYDYGEAARGKPNGAKVYDVLTEPDGAEMFERCLPVHARFALEARERWPKALDEIERLRELVREACSLATTHRAEDRMRINAIQSEVNRG